jgi:hypothetical protein
MNIGSEEIWKMPLKKKIELKPDDYKMALYYFSIKDVKEVIPKNSSSHQAKRNQLENLISNNAVIYQVYDNNIYGIETWTNRSTSPW